MGICFCMDISAPPHPKACEKARAAFKALLSPSAMASLPSPRMVTPKSPSARGVICMRSKRSTEATTLSMV